jgi:hypothetical protein
MTHSRDILTFASGVLAWWLAGCGVLACLALGGCMQLSATETVTAQGQIVRRASSVSFLRAAPAPVLETTSRPATGGVTWHYGPVPVPPTPAQKALGLMVLGGAILCLIGGAGMALRWLPWTAAWANVVPIGVSVIVFLLGVCGIAFGTFLSSAPWWAQGLCVAGAIALGYYVATRDNVKRAWV